MKAYLICFTLTPILVYIAEKKLKREKKVNGIILCILAMLIPCILAGIRDTDVGRDIFVYVDPILKLANNTSFEDYWNNYQVVRIEKGYAIFVYLISFITSNTHMLMFILQLVPITIVFYFAYYYREKFPMWFTITVYLLIWYCRSYTIMRQTISVALILLSTIKFNEKKYFRTAILFILAILFHYSAIVSIGIYILFYINNQKFHHKLKILLYFFIFSLLIIMVIFYNELLYFFTYEIEILPEKFYLYLESDYATEGAKSFFEIGSRCIWLLLGFLGIKRIKDDKNYITYYLLLVVQSILYIISYELANAERIGYYYYYIGLIYTIPSLIKMFKDNKENKVWSYLMIITILFAFWFWKYPIQKNCETYPYRTSIIKVLN